MLPDDHAAVVEERDRAVTVRDNALLKERETEEKFLTEHQQRDHLRAAAERAHDLGANAAAALRRSGPGDKDAHDTAGLAFDRIVALLRRGVDGRRLDPVTVGATEGGSDSADESPARPRKA